MGQTTSTDYTNNIVNSTINVMNSQTQACYSSGEQAQNILLENCNIIDSTIKISQLAIVDTTCVQQGVEATSVSSYVDSQIAQTAQSETQGMGLSNTEASTFIDSSIDVSTAVTNSFTQSMSSATDQQQGFECDNSNIVGSVVSMDQVEQTMQTALAVNTAYTTASNSISTAISQATTAKQTGLLAMLVKGLIVIGIIIVVFLMGSFAFASTTFTKALTSPSFWMIAAGGAGILNIGLAHMSWWPYSDDMDKSTKNVAVLSGSAASLITMGGLGYMISKTKKPIKPIESKIY